MWKSANPHSSLPALVPALGVVGFPINHSLSPAIFTFLSQKFNIPLSYSKFSVQPEEFLDFLNFVKQDPAFLGLNLTVPHKVKGRQVADWISIEAEMTGAVNVLRIEDNRLLGWNTDAFGVSQTLRENKIPIKGKNFCIYGAGGAARAAIYSLANESANKIVIVNRTVKKADEIAKRFARTFPSTQFECFQWKEKMDLAFFSSSFAGYINSTSVGLNSQPEFQFFFPSPIQHDADICGAFALDMMYGVGQTLFLKAAAQANVASQDGLSMLVWQALRAWEIWFGNQWSIQSDIQQVKEMVLTELLKHIRKE